MSNNPRVLTPKVLKEAHEPHAQESRPNKRQRLEIHAAKMRETNAASLEHRASIQAGRKRKREERRQSEGNVNP